MTDRAQTHPILYMNAVIFGKAIIYKCSHITEASGHIAQMMSKVNTLQSTPMSASQPATQPAGSETQTDTVIGNHGNATMPHCHAQN